jgi:hypothetical protein
MSDITQQAALLEQYAQAHQELTEEDKAQAALLIPGGKSSEFYLGLFMGFTMAGPCDAHSREIAAARAAHLFLGAHHISAQFARFAAMPPF